MKTRQQLVTSRSKTNAGTNTRRYITIHETANTGRGADAAAHADLQSRGNVRQASWHWQVDDTEAVQSFPHTVRCWHAGDGDGPGNNSSIGIEICVNRDGDFKKAVENAAALTRKIMADEGIPLERVVQHSRWSGKNCPTFLRSGSKGVTWTDFLRLVAGATPVSKPSKPSKPSGGIAVDGYWGRATTHRLQQVLGTVADGEVWFQHPKNKQRALTSGWVWNWSRGTKGSPLIRRMQGVMQADGQYRGQIDGVVGPEFFKALQRRYGTIVDGELWSGSPAVKAMQSRLNSGRF